MFPRPTPPPKKRKPTLPLPYEIMHGIPDLAPFDVVTQEVLAMAETTDKAHLLPYLQNNAYAQLRGEPSDLLLAAIDPATGDSFVHRAAAAGNIKGLHAVPASFGPNYGNMPESVRQLWVLITHQNLAGDTPIHAAARAGSLKGVKGVYRLFHEYDCLDVDDNFHDDEVARVEESAREKCVIDMPIEYFDWSNEEDDRHAHLPALYFVCMKNQAGRDAAAEARLAGHEGLAVFLDGLVERLDRDHMRKDEGYMQKAKLAGLKSHWYIDDKEEE